MVAQNAKNGNDNQHVERRMPDVHEQLDALEQWVERSAKDGTAAHQVERGLFDKLLALGKSLFGGFLNLVGPGDFGETVSLDDGRLVHRSAELHQRGLKTVFGEFTLSRWVYAQREKSRFEFMPTDQRLQLPASEVSYLLQEWDQLLGIEHAFGKVREVIQTILRLPQTVDTLEHTHQQMAAAAPAFRDEPGTGGSGRGREIAGGHGRQQGDSDGASRRGEAGRGPSDQRRKGEQETDGLHRLCLFGGPAHAYARGVGGHAVSRFGSTQGAAAAAQNKRYWAELSRDLDGEEIRGQDLVFQQLQAEIKLRRQPGQRLVHLSDGQASLATDRQRYLPEDEWTLDILDLMHVLPCVWEAAHMFHAEGSKEATQFVRDRLTRILQGQAGRVIGGLRQMAQRLTSGQEETAASDLRLSGEKQAPHALR